MESRTYWIDFLKGIMIVLVIAGHCDIHSIIKTIIYMFHMPAFFIISGYLLKDYSSWESFVQRRGRRLVYPYISFGIIILFYNTVVFSIWKGDQEYSFYKGIIALLYGNDIWSDNAHYIGVLWFLLALFWSEIVVLYIERQKNKVLPSIVVLLIGIVISLINTKYHFRFPFCIDIACASFFFVLVGKRLNQHDLPRTVISIILIILGVLLGLIHSLVLIRLDILPSRIDMLQMNYGIIPVFYLSATMITIGTMGLSKSIYKKRRFLLIEHIGRISMIVMVSHLYILQILHQFIPNGYACFAITAISSVLFSMLIEKHFHFIYDYSELCRLFSS